MVVGGGVVVGDDLLVAVLIFSTLAPLLRERARTRKWCDRLWFWCGNRLCFFGLVSGGNRLCLYGLDTMAAFVLSTFPDTEDDIDQEEEDNHGCNW